MLPMSCSDTSVPMEISAASLTSASISSGRMSDRSEPATFVRSPDTRSANFKKGHSTDFTHKVLFNCHQERLIEAVPQMMSH